MKRILLAIVIGCPVAIWAQDTIKIDIKPGLWENTVTSTMSGMQVPANMPQLSPEQLAKIPPEQRARIEAMMKGGAGAPQTRVMKSCVTAEELSKPLFNSGEKSCTYKMTGSSSSSQQIHVECTPGNNKMTGDVNLQRSDSEHYKGDVEMKMTGDPSSGRGGPQNMTVKVNFNAKYLGSDCGDVKPGSAEVVK